MDEAGRTCHQFYEISLGDLGGTRTILHKVTLSKGRLI